MTKEDKDLGKYDTESSNKKPYHSPQLVIYGDIRQLTLTKQTSTMSDNPGMENNMSVF